MNILNRLVPKSLAGQLIGLLLLALVGGHIVALVIFSDERREAIEATTRGQILSRTAAVVRLLEATPRDLHERVLDSASTSRLRFSLSDRPDSTQPPTSGREKGLARRLARQLGPLAGDIRIQSTARQYFSRWQNWHEDEMEEHHTRMRRFRNLDLQLSVKLADGHWLNVKTEVGAYGPAWAFQSLIALFVAGFAIIAIVIVVVRRITRPLRSLTEAAEGLGRGEKGEDIEPEGPEDMRRTIDAFNRMRHRLERFIEDRTNMLAAVSHDLKTPITALRIRAEFIEDAELKEKIIQTLDEMQAITESTLSFAREEAEREQNRRTDLTALLESLCGDYTDRGDQVDFSSSSRIVMSCRPTSLKRALNNVLENAIAYGERAYIELSYNADTDLATLTIDDDGPGIPESDLERVFQPFVRVETSRSRETGGTGLGLAIARSIIRGHGGDISLTNRKAGGREEGGLRVTIHIPGDLSDTA
jgi:signal transduction histidine kinase